MLALAVPAVAQVVTVGPGAQQDVSGQTLDGVIANGGSITGTGATISSTNSHIASAIAGGSIELDGGAVELVHSGNGQFAALFASGADSTLTATGFSIRNTSSGGPALTNNFSFGVNATSGGAIILNGGTITSDGSAAVTGSASTRAYAMNTGAGGTVNATNVVIDTKGHRAHAVVASGGTISLQGARVRADGGSSFAYGLIANSGTYGPARIVGSAEVTTLGVDSYGAYAANGALHRSSILLNGGWIKTSGLRSHGLLAEGPGTTIESSVDVTTSGNSASGAVAVGGGTITLTGGRLSAQGNTAHGLHARGAGSSISSAADLATAGEWSYGAFAEDGASVALTAGTITTTANRGFGLLAMNEGVITNAANIQTSGPNAHAVQAYSGTITLSGGVISTQGENSYGVFARRNTADGTSQPDGRVTGVVDITTAGFHSFGAYAWGGATVDITGGRIRTTGLEAYGLRAELAGSTVTSRATITTAGERSAGAVAERGGFVDILAGSVTTTGANSPGLYAFGSGSRITSRVDVTTSGAGSHGAAVETGNAIEILGGTARASGAGAAGALVSGGTLLVRNAAVVSAQHVGLDIRNGGTVSLLDATLASAGAAMQASFTEAGRALDVTLGAGAVATENNGTLLAVARGANGGDATVSLTVESGASASGDITDTDAKTTGYTDVTLKPGSQWSGQMYGVRNIVSAPGGRHTFLGSTTIAGSLQGKGSTHIFSTSPDVVIVIERDVVLEEGSSTTGGSVQSPVQVKGNVAVDTTSTLGGNWAIGGNLAMGGLLSPGNSPGIITVGGNYAAAPGATLNAEVNLTAPRSIPGVTHDQVNIGGNVTGVTSVRLLPYLASSPWLPLGDISGVRLVTVGGTASPGAFVQASGRIVQGGHDIVLDYRPGGAGSPSVFGLKAQVANESYVLASVPAIASTVGLELLGTYAARRELDWSGEQAGWARVVGGRFRQGRAAGVGFDSSIEGAQAGIDLLQLGGDPATRIGLAFAHGTSAGSVKRRSGGRAGSTDTDQTAVGAYLTHNGAFFAELLAQYRFIAVDMTSPLTPKMSVDGGSFDIAAEIGKRFAFGGLTVAPSLQLVYQRMTLDGYRDASFNARYGDDDTLFGRFNVLVEGRFGGIRPYASFGIGADLLGDKTTTVSGLPLRNSTGGVFNVGAGLEASLGPQVGVGIAGEYNASFDGRASGYLARGSFRVRF